MSIQPAVRTLPFTCWNMPGVLMSSREAGSSSHGRSKEIPILVVRDSETPGGDDVLLPMGGKEIGLQDVDVVSLDYCKCPDVQHEQLREDFNSHGRKDFLQDLAEDVTRRAALAQAGISAAGIQLMAHGRVPRGFQVHHKIPLDGGGTNDFSNLTLIRNEPAHQALTSLQNRSMRGMHDGEERSINWIVPHGPVYPSNPAAVSLVRGEFGRQVQPMQQPARSSGTWSRALPSSGSARPAPRASCFHEADPVQVTSNSTP